MSFSTKLAQKGYFQTKKKNENDHLILHIQINLDSKFQLQQFRFYRNFQKKDTSGQKQKKIIITTEFFIFESV